MGHIIGASLTKANVCELLQRLEADAVTDTVAEVIADTSYSGGLRYRVKRNKTTMVWHDHALGLNLSSECIRAEPKVILC